MQTRLHLTAPWRPLAAPHWSPSPPRATESRDSAPRPPPRPTISRAAAAAAAATAPAASPCGSGLRAPACVCLLARAAPSTSATTRARATAARAAPCAGPGAQAATAAASASSHPPGPPAAAEQGAGELCPRQQNCRGGLAGAAGAPPRPRKRQPTGPQRCAPLRAVCRPRVAEEAQSSSTMRRNSTAPTRWRGPRAPGGRGRAPVRSGLPEPARVAGPWGAPALRGPGPEQRGPWRAAGGRRRRGGLRGAHSRSGGGGRGRAVAKVAKAWSTRPGQGCAALTQPSCRAAAARAAPGGAGSGLRRGGLRCGGTGHWGCPSAAAARWWRCQRPSAGAQGSGSAA